MNGTTKFLSTVSEEDKGRTRNVCNKTGYESVSLTPLRDNERIIGLIHLADRRENLVPRFVVEVMEQAGIAIGEAVQRIRTEAALRESEDRFRNLADLLPTIIFEATPDGALTFANKAAYATFGYSKEELGGAPHFSQFVVPEDRERAGSRWLEILRENPPPRSIEYTFIRKDGSLFPGLITNAPIIRDGTTVGVRGTILDISALRESEARLTFALTASKSGTWDWDMVHDVSQWSPEMHLLFGVPPGTPIKPDTWVNLLHPDDRVRALREVEASLADHTTLTTDYRIILPDGAVRWITSVGTTTYENGGRPVRRSGICFDATEKKHAEIALEQARKKLSLLNTVTFQDIQSLIFSTSAYINLIKTTSDPVKIGEYLAREGELVRQIDGCLDFSHTYQDLGKTAPRWQKLGDVIIYAISHLNFASVEKTLDLDSLEVFADPLLEKAMVHIVRNLIGGTRRMTLLTAERTETEDAVIVSITGNNEGIPAEEKKTLFQHSIGGHRGLGLFLAGEILSITGISIRETGVPGEYTRFEMMIPKGTYRIGHR